MELPDAGIVLIASASATAFLHAVIPDHWLPFVLVGKAQGWSKGKTLSYSALSATLHVVVSIALGTLGYIIGIASASSIGENIESVIGISLLLFGIFYSVWGLKSQGGALHIGHSHGPHSHEDNLKGKKGNITGWGLALVMGLNPCIVALPVISATVSKGLIVMLLASAAFALTTILLLVGLTSLGLLTSYKFKFKFLEKYGEVLSGIILSLTGIAFLI